MSHKMRLIAAVLLVEGLYTQQGTRTATAPLRSPTPGDAARPALMSWAAHAVESKVVVRIEVAVSPRPCLGCAVELALRVAPLRPPRRPTPAVRSA
jgi:hypothetical protein